jgi:glyoxylase-like metal-dependent hydrolase (beta-lactamase superfamily II)
MCFDHEPYQTAFNQVVVNGVRVNVTKRMALQIAVCALAGLASFLTASAFAQTQSPALALPSPDVRLSVNALSGGAYWVGGGVSNAGFVIGKNGVIAIDAQYFAITAKNELAEIAKITPEPVSVVILTHSDPDHINGLPAFPIGAEVIAQQNARSEMIEALADPHPNFTKPPAELKDHLPYRRRPGRVPACAESRFRG